MAAVARPSLSQRITRTESEHADASAEHDMPSSNPDVVVRSCDTGDQDAAICNTGAETVK
jgi:hypothetical protein